MIPGWNGNLQYPVKKKKLTTKRVKSVHYSVIQLTYINTNHGIYYTYCVMYDIMVT